MKIEALRQFLLDKSIVKTNQINTDTPFIE